MSQQIPLTKGMWAVVSDQDYDWLRQFRWYALTSHGDYYAARWVRTNGQYHHQLMHRVITNCPDNKVPHHKDGDTLNNQRENLEICDQSENLKYRRWSKEKI